MSSRSYRPAVCASHTRAWTSTTPESGVNRTAAAALPSAEVFATRRLRSTSSGNAATSAVPPDVSTAQPAGIVPGGVPLKSSFRLCTAGMAAFAGL